MNIKTLATLTLMFSVGANASNITPFINYTGNVNLAITGEIEDGDEEVLKGTIQDIRSNGLAVDYVALDSKGGDDDTALKMSYAIKSVNANTIIADNALCTNSCFILFAAGNKKIIAKRGKVAIKKFDPNVAADTGTKNTLLTINDIYTFYGIPAEFITSTLDKTTNKLYWFKKKDKAYFDSEKDVIYEEMSLFSPFKKDKRASGYEHYLNGISYFTGINAVQSYKLAFESLKLAADENVPEALHKLGVMYYKGIYVEQDSDAAEDYWNQSATLGYYPSLSNLTLTYETSDNQEDLEVNERILASTITSDMIRSYSAKVLGDIYYNGVGVEKSELMALSYYQASAELGDAEGQYKYSTMLIRNQNLKDAYLWLNASCSVGFSDSCRYLKR